LLFGSIYQHFTFFANSYQFYLVLLLKNYAVQYRLLWWENRTRLW